MQDCRPRHYYSKFLDDCVPCPGKCVDDEDAHDVDRCKEACETKTTGAPRLPTTTFAFIFVTTTTVSKNDQPTPQVATLINTTSLEVRSTRTTPKALQSENPGTEHSTNVGLAVSIGVLGTFVVCLVAYVIWRCKSRTSRDVVARIEEGDEPSTSSQESSPEVTKRPQSCPVSSLEKIEEGMRLPVPETEKLIPNAKDSHASSINVEECEN